jgi:hypothetical protein
MRGAVDISYLALAAVAACLAPNATVELADALRNTAVLLVLVPFALASVPLLSGSTERAGAP